jgi:DNA modification methylase
MERRKMTKEDIDKVRDIEGFPIGTDEDIIALSDAPYYTACPNPFIEEFIRENGTPYDETTDDYHCEPFAADVSEGKNDPIYNAHSYHTKVPYKAIMRYILHYTKPGDVILDGFSGSGMTGVAAQKCGSADSQERFPVESTQKGVQWGSRYALLTDLSPIASFLGKNYNEQVDMLSVQEQAKDILNECEKKCAWMFKTRHTERDNRLTQMSMGDDDMGSINCTIWSDVLICPHCGEEFVLWDVALDKDAGKVRDIFNCPKCTAALKKKDCEHAVDQRYDNELGEVIAVDKQVPVLINYNYLGKRYNKTPDEEDLALIDKIYSMPLPNWVPTDRMCEGTESRRNDKSGIKYVHQFFTRRNLIVLSELRDCLFKPRINFEYTALISRSTKQLRLLVSYFFHGGGGWVGTGLSGTLYLPSFSIEQNAIKTLQGKLSGMVSFDYAKRGNVLSSTQSTTDLRNIPNNSIDYIFTDPPFGDNLNYSELSFIWESWLRIKTNQKCEAIMNEAQGKHLLEYQQLMTACFSEYFRVLKPNRWMTVEFHNSKNAVWNAIQEALQKSGFIVADVRTLDKKQGSFKQVNNTSAVKQDLVISVYKPKESFLRGFSLKAGTEETAWDFVRQHLENIPVVVLKNDKIELIAERQAYLLFDRMIAYHIMQGIPVPLDAVDFYKGLDEKFLKRDNMFFLPDQVNEYDTARIVNEVEPIQFSLFVTNEKTAISWLYQQLDEPQTYADIQPKFMQEVKSVDRYEAMPELAVLLEENFLQDENGRWYIPDVTKEGDVAKLREKKLWKEFEGYLNSKGKLKLFRSEAIRVGFSRLWKDKNYQAIVDIANRLPEQTIQEDPNLLMYYDISLGRV